jgi:hypothetical protein
MQRLSASAENGLNDGEFRDNDRWDVSRDSFTMPARPFVLERTSSQLLGSLKSE